MQGEGGPVAVQSRDGLAAADAHAVSVPDHPSGIEACSAACRVYGDVDVRFPAAGRPRPDLCRRLRPPPNERPPPDPVGRPGASCPRQATSIAADRFRALPPGGPPATSDTAPAVLRRPRRHLRARAAEAHRRQKRGARNPVAGQRSLGTPPEPTSSPAPHNRCPGMRERRDGKRQGRQKAPRVRHASEATRIRRRKANRAHNQPRATPPTTRSSTSSRFIVAGATRGRNGAARPTARLTAS